MQWADFPTMKKLFDDAERYYQGPAEYTEPEFTYLNRSAIPQVIRIREALEAWFSRYPGEGKEDLWERFRSTDNLHHRSAFFELFLHELLLRLGCYVMIHPSMDNSTRSYPYFLVESPSGISFYTEAVLAIDESVEKTAARARMNEVYDVLERQLNSPNFFIGMKIRSTPQTTPPARHMTAFLTQRLAPLDPVHLASLFEAGGFDALPHWHYEQEGWRIVFFPIPKSLRSRGKEGVRPLGFLSPEPRWMHPRVPIRDAVVKKAARYGDFDLAYVIAVNTLSNNLDRIDIMEALFGKEQCWMIRTRSGSIQSKTRKPDGVWLSESGPRYRQVSAVLITDTLRPYNLPRASLWLCHNPWGKKPYTSELTRLPQAFLKDDWRRLDCMRWLDGESPGEIFDLHKEWPAV